MPYVMIAAAAVSAVGSIKAGNAASAAHKYQADISERNAKVAEQEKDILDLRTGQEVLAFSDQFKGIQSTAGVAYAKSGVQTGTGTPLQLLLVNSQEADADIAEARYNAELGKRALDEKAMEFRLRGNVSKMEARSARIAGFTKAGGSLLSAWAKR